MFSKDQKTLQDLTLEFAKALITAPGYEFRQEDKLKYYDPVEQKYKPEWKYELVLKEARRFAHAYLAMYND